MLPVHDVPLRVALLSHLAWRLRERSAGELNAAGLDRGQLARLKQFSTVDLGRLAARRDLVIGVRLEPASLRAALRAMARDDDACALESYFLRNGASWQMMKALFKIRRKLTLERRHEIGAWRPSGRNRLPDFKTRERIFRLWLAIEEPDPRRRYYHLHQRIPYLSIAALEAVIRECESEAARRARSFAHAQESDP